VVDYRPDYSGGEDAAFADRINNATKYVVSTTLDGVGAWRTSTLVKGDLAETVARTKRGEGKDIAVAGSPGLVTSLLEPGLPARSGTVIATHRPAR